MTRYHLRDRVRGLLQSGVPHVFLVRGVGVLALFALEISLGRQLGVTSYGIFSFVLVVATVVARLAPLGWLNASTRLVRTYTGQHEMGLLKGSLIAAHVATALGLLAASLFLLGLAAFGGDSETAPLFRLAVPLGIALTAVELHRYVLRGQHASTLGEALPMLLLPLGVLSGIWGLGLASVEGVVLAYVAVSALTLALSSSRILRRLPSGIGRTPADFRLRAWAGMAFAMLVGTASDELTARTAVLILGVLDTHDAVGHYQAAARLALMTLFVLRVVTAVAAPRIAELYHAGKLTEVRSVYGRSCLLSALGAAPFLLLYGLGPEFAVSLFGAGFQESAPILRILAIGSFVSATAGPCATALMMIGREKTYGVIAIIGLGANVAGMLLVIPHYHALGAAVVAAGVLIAVNLCYTAVVLHATRPRRKEAPVPAAAPLLRDAD